MRIHIMELPSGYWQGAIEGEDSDGVLDRSPDQALAGLVRMNIRRLGIEAITYGFMAEESRDGSEGLPSQGDVVLPLGSSLHSSDRKKG